MATVSVKMFHIHFALNNMSRINCRMTRFVVNLM